MAHAGKELAAYAVVQSRPVGMTGFVWSLDVSSPNNTWGFHPTMPAGTQRGASVTGAIGTTIYLAGGLRNGAVAEVSAFTSFEAFKQASMIACENGRSWVPLATRRFRAAGLRAS